MNPPALIRLTAIFPSLMIFLLAGISTPAAATNLTDLLNRTTAWTHSQPKTLTLKAHPDARVWFNGVEIQNFDGEHPVQLGTPGEAGQWVPWDTLAILEGAGEGAGNPPQTPHASPDAKAAQSGAVWTPPAAETLHYDAAGNRQETAQWHYGWDAKNQLVRARTKNHTTAPQAFDLTFTYDSEGRRVKKHVVEYQNGNIVSEKIITFVWDDWDLLYERHQLPSGLTTLERKYLCGPDLADGAAGGAGGLLLIRETKGNTTTNIIPLYDGTGHVVALTDINKNLLATYAYGPFGEKISANGPLAQSNPWRYATKYLDEETGLYYFGHRYFDPVTGQFLSRDPLGENESINLYAYCHNDPVNKVDVLGLSEAAITGEFMDATGMTRDIKNFFNMIFGGRWSSDKAATAELKFEEGRLGGMYGGGMQVATFGMLQPETNPTPASEFGMWLGRPVGAVYAAPFVVGQGGLQGTRAAYTYGGQWLSVYGTSAARTAWGHGGVRAAAYGGGGVVGFGTGYGLLTDQQFRGEFITLEQISGLPGEGMVLFGRGLQMAGRDAKAALHGFDFLSFSSSTNRRLPVQILPEPMYIVPPTSSSSSSRAWPSTWDGARGRYWTEVGRKEYTQSTGWYSQSNILEMLAGRSPKIRAEIRLPNGMTEIRDIPIELHHYLLAQRSGGKTAHEPWNLTPALPWSHAGMDEFRHVDFELIRIISGPNSWTP